MRNVLIDANMYLWLYSTTHESAEEALAFLEPLSSRVFVTQQVVDEVRRNRVQVAAAAGGPPMPKIVPPAFLHVISPEIRKVAFESKKLFEETIRSAEVEFAKHMNAVLDGSDRVSKALDRLLFNAPESPRGEQIARAVARKQVGNPPGKPNDPLGDQVTWVQFEDEVGGSLDAFIVSADDDYSTKVRGKRILNAFLRNDLTGVQSVEVYDNFPDALESLRNKPDWTALARLHAAAMRNSPPQNPGALVFPAFNLSITTSTEPSGSMTSAGSVTMRVANQPGQFPGQSNADILRAAMMQLSDEEEEEEAEGEDDAD
jgi:hypothetical protein